MSAPKGSKTKTVNLNNKTQLKVVGYSNSKYNTNIKDVMNTSAPICISSYLNQSHGQLQRP